jgi:hypothetical protein
MEKEEIPEQETEQAPAAPAPSPPKKRVLQALVIKRESGWSRIMGFPLLKRSIVMAEILGPPGGIGEKG